jgi:cell division FtsZ-interacting protein ZapD
MSPSIATHPYQLLRICLPAGVSLYPEISGSHYRCSMRFLSWNGIEQRADADRSGRALRLDLLHLKAMCCCKSHR